MREFDRDHTCRFEKYFQSAHKVINIGNLCQNIVPSDQICLFAFFTQLRGQFAPKELSQGWNAFFDRNLGHVFGWLNAQHRDSRLDEVLQQVAVITGDFDDQTILVQSKTVQDHFSVFFAVFQPCICIG